LRRANSRSNLARASLQAGAGETSVSGDAQALDAPLDPEGLEVGHVLAPADRNVAGDRGAASATLVVIDERAPVGEGIEAGQQVVVLGARSAVQHDRRRTIAAPPLEERNIPDLPDRGARVRRALAQSSTASASATFRTSASSSAVNGSGTSLSMSICPSTVVPRRISTTSSDRVQRLQAM